MSRNDHVRAVSDPITSPNDGAASGPAILVVSDDAPEAGNLVARLLKHGYTARAVACADVPKGSAGADPSADLALVDLAPAGIEAAERLGDGHGVPVVYLTGGADGELLRRARGTRPFGYLVPTVGTAQLRLNIESAIEAHAREREHRETRRRLEGRIASMRSRERLLNTILDNVSDGVIAADSEGDYILSNRVARRIVGGDLPDVEMARRPEEFGFYRPDGETPVRLEELPLPRALAGEATDAVEIVVRNPSIPDGLRLSINGRPVELGDGTPGAILVFQDITRARTAEDEVKKQMGELREQKNLLDTILNSMSDGVIVAGMDGRLVYVNQSVMQMIADPEWPLPPSEWAAAYGLFHLDRKTFITPEDMPIIHALQGAPAPAKEFYIRNDQTPETGRYISASAHPLRSPDDGRLIGAVGFIADITHHKETEARLRKTLREIREHDDLMRTVFTSMGEGVVVADKEGNFTLFNPAAEKIVGVGMVDVGPDQWTDKYGLFYPDQKTLMPTDELPLVRAIMGKKSVDMEIFVRNELRPDGVTILVNGEPLQGEEGDQLGGVAVFRDVTEQRTAEMEGSRVLKELREQTDLMETVFDSISEGIVAVDKTGAVIHVNRQASLISKMDYDTPSDTWARRFGIYYPDRETRVKNENLPVLRAAFQGEAVDEDVVLINELVPEGVTLRVSARPLLDSNGSRRGGVAVIRDVSEVRRAEDALAEAFAQGKIEVIDTILHNVGNAVNSVSTGIDTISRTLRDDTLMGRLEMLVKALEEHEDDWVGYISNHPQGRLVLPFVLALGKDLVRRDQRIRKAAKRARGRSEHIAEIIRTQRVFKRQAGAKKEVDLRESFAEVVGLMELPLLAAGVKVEIDCENAPRTVYTHESELQQSIVNLVKNSVDAINARGVTRESEWTPTIWMRAYVRGTHLMMEVEDNGIGIPSDKLHAMFSPGYSTKKEGTGLGLHSTANFIRRSGGLIWAVSEGVGHGAKIRMEVRLEALGIVEDGGDGARRTLSTVTKNPGGGGVANQQSETR